jgi:osomolarity two-component system sensor histidine kinase SLN1
MATNQDYNLIFMDVQMPNMDGLEATRLIRKLGFKRPIVALSAYSDDTNVRSCHDCGMDDFVSKPIQIARLKLVLKTYCPNEETPLAGSSVTTEKPVSGSSRVGRSHSLTGGTRNTSSPISLRKEAAAPLGERESKSPILPPGDDDVSPLSSPPLPQVQK